MRAIFFGRKNMALRALDHILDRRWSVLAVIPKIAELNWMPRPHFRDGLEQRKVPFTDQPTLIQAINGEPSSDAVRKFLSEPVDLILSYLFPDRVLTPVLSLPRLGAVNFHPGPLPEYGGLAGYNYAILDRRTSYGVTAHHMNLTFDTGDLILRRDFEFDCDKATAFDLERMGRSHLLRAFEDVVQLVEAGIRLPSIPQGETRYTNKREFEASKKVDLQSDSAESIECKTRAFWYPPYTGAYVETEGTRFTLVPDVVLKQMVEGQESSEVV
jgi:methionyl-tRNA formyltransferase